jgi:hypothetical protein
MPDSTVNLLACAPSTRAFAVTQFMNLESRPRICASVDEVNALALARIADV